MLKIVKNSFIIELQLSDSFEFKHNGQLNP